MVEIAERLRPYADFAEVPFVLHYGAKRKESAIRIVPTIGAYFRVIRKVAKAQRSIVPAATLLLAFSPSPWGRRQMLLRQGASGLGGAGFSATLWDALAHPDVLSRPRRSTRSRRSCGSACCRGWSWRWRIR